MKADREMLATRSWAIPSICGLLVLHHDFKRGRFSKVTRLEWAESSVDIHFQYGIVNATGNVVESVRTVINVHQSGVVGILFSDLETHHNHRDILHFLVGETSREALRWSQDLVAWRNGALDDEVKSSTIALVCAVVAHPFTRVCLAADKSLSNARVIQKIVLLHDAISTELTPSGTYGVNVYQAGLGAFEDFRHRYVEQDFRFGAAHEESSYGKFIDKVSYGLLTIMLLPVATLAYFGDKMLMAEQRTSDDLVDYLPDTPLESRVDAGMSALSG